MSELTQILVTSSLTVCSGVILLVIGQVLIKFVIEPIHRQAELKGEVADSLIFYAYLYSNPGTGRTEEMDEAFTILRRQASQPMARTSAIPAYRFWERLGLVPRYKQIKKASASLIGLANSLNQGTPEFNERRRTEIEESLGTRTR